MMLYTDPPKHTRYRRLVSKGFTPRMIGLLEQYLRHRSRLIVDNVIERGSCDFVVDVASELPLQAIAEIMGVPQEDRHLIFEWSNAMIGADDPEFEGGADGCRDAASAALYAYVNELAKQRRTDPRDDIVTKLINAEVDGEKLSELEFDMFMLLLSVAGNETTRNTTAWGMWALMQHPEQYASLRDNLDSQLTPAVEEILRWASPVYHFRRTTTAPTEIHGQEIAEGDKVVMWYISANRDESVFDDPFRFDITREPEEQVAFGGGGHHFCLGANLARMELQAHLRGGARRASPTCTWSPSPRSCARTSSAASSTWRWSTRPAPGARRRASSQHRRRACVPRSVRGSVRPWLLTTTTRSRSRVGRSI